MAEILSWPTNPITGDIYTHNGNYWVFDGCMWISTCCPNACSIFSTGIILGVTIYRKFPGNEISPYTIKFCLRYQESSESWVSEATDSVGSTFLTITEGDVINEWIINNVVNGIPYTIGNLSSNEPIGAWTSEEDDIKLETVCGCTPTICACFYDEVTSPIVCDFSINYFPVSFTGINGDTEAWTDFESKTSIVYNTSTLLWELNDNVDVLYAIGGTSTNPPIGTWELEDGEWTYLTTSLGNCNTCIPVTDGLIFAYEDKGTQTITYIPLTWNTLCQCFISSDGTIQIKEDPPGSETWTLTINGDPYLITFDSYTPVGSWDLYVTILCGNTSVDNAEGCLTATGTENETLFLQETGQGFGYGNPFVRLWRIVCEAGTWYIEYYDDFLAGWVTYATAAGSCSTPPFGLTWTVEDGPYISFSFVSGPCP
jgi:hypothetical protein